MAKKTTNLPSKKDAEDIVSNKEYIDTLAFLKKRIRESQLNAAVAVNRELLCTYWSIGKTIADKQEKSGWGSKVIEKLARDIQNEFPGLEGFSRTNIFRLEKAAWFKLRYFWVTLTEIKMINAESQRRDDAEEINKSS
jgi:hypothetical protein